jgi:hypothetical protein
MTTLKKLPLGIESFTKIIDDNLLYADKTKYIYDLLRSKDRNYFLARPKKFGKTLLINTLETLFSGERERFRGLWLDRSDYDFSKHPVISLSMQAEAKGPKILEANLLYSLRAIAKTNTLDIEVTRPSLYFRALIKALHDSFNSKVAVLIDEYDGSVTGNLRNQELALANAKVLNSFYGALKQAADYVHVTFVTGVSRYALTFIDLEPDYLKDITLESKYTGLCGLTIEEFDDLFAERFHCALEAMKAKGVIKPTCQVGDFRKDIISGYGGYNWGDERGVLNPHSLLHFFDELAFEHFWSRSKMPSHLTALIETRLGDITEPKLKSYVSTPISQTALTELSIPSALFHLGYLTIDKVFDKVLVGAEDGSQDSHEDSYEDGHIETYYSLKHPNLETSTSYRHYFNITIRDIQEQFYNNKKNDLLKAFLDRDAQTVSSILRDYVFSVGFRQTIYDQSQKTYDDEISLHHLLMWLFIILGFDTAFVDIPLITEPFVLGFERDQVYLIIKFKYYPMNYRILNNNEINIIDELLLDILIN